MLASNGFKPATRSIMVDVLVALQPNRSSKNLLAVLICREDYSEMPVRCSFYLCNAYYVVWLSTGLAVLPRSCGFHVSYCNMVRACPQTHCCTRGKLPMVTDAVNAFSSGPASLGCYERGTGTARSGLMSISRVAFVLLNSPKDARFF